jgi:ribosome-associated protein YbcJ (S4-like RNA binding protein)
LRIRCQQLLKRLRLSCSGGKTKALLAEKADLVEAEVTDEKTRRNQS